MNKQIKYLYKYIFLLVSISILLGCSNKEKVEEISSISMNDVSENSVSIDTISDNTVSENKVDEKETIQYYINLENEGTITLDEYFTWAKLLANENDDISARKILWRAYRIYPEKRTSDALAEFVMDINADDEEYNQKFEMISLLKEAFEQDSLNLELLDTSEWKENFWLGEGVFNTNTRLNTEDGFIQVSSLVDSTCVLCVHEDNTFEYYVINNDNALYVSGSYKDLLLGASLSYDGDECIRWYKGNELHREVSCTVANNLLVGQLDIIINGTSYEGSFDENGKTLEEQPPKVEGVVYAYSSNKKKYLYSEEEELVANISLIGLPEINIWE